MSEWKEITLGDEVDLLTGFPFKSELYTGSNDAIRLVRGDNIVQGCMRWDGVKKYPISEVSQLDTYYLVENDVVLAMDRPWIEAGLKYAEISKSDLPCLLVQRTARLRAKSTIYQRFLKYVIGSNGFTQHIHSITTGTAVPHISSKQIKDYKFQLPPLPEQKRIAKILGDLDDKIELNRKMNATLEEMARALFQSWFVDFDPVHAKAEGRAPAGMDAETAKLFPSEFVESELGMIPKGWEVNSLGSVLDVLETGRRPKGGVSSYTSGVPSVGAESINGVGVFDYGKTKYVPFDFYENMNSGKVAWYDVLLYKDGGKPGEFRPRVGMYGCDFPFKHFGINEHVFRMRSEILGQQLLYFTISDPRVLNDFANKGGKAAIPGINQVDVKSTRILIPSRCVISKFNALSIGLINKILINSTESKKLTSSRDILLLELLSNSI